MLLLLMAAVTQITRIPSKYKREGRSPYFIYFMRSQKADERPIFIIQTKLEPSIDLNLVSTE